MAQADAPRRFAAIDCGTNSIRLLISERAADGTLTELNRDNIIVRLGQGVDATGGFAPEALQRVDDALATYAQRMVDHNVEDVMMGATSATRDAKNRDEFFAITARHLGRIVEGRQAEVISGEQEAELSFAGAVADLPSGTPERICVIDLGGGSTEFVVHDVDADGAVADTGTVEAYSANMGCVRLTERYLHSNPPTAEEIAAAEDYVAEQIREVEEHVDLTGVTRLVGVAGTMTTLSAITQGLDSYQPEKIHLSRLPLRTFRDTAIDLRDKTVDQRLECGPMHPGRADVVGGGAVVIDAVASRFLALGVEEITISEKDILDGMLAKVMRRNGA
ncbi:Ppx/GppA phosphatase family protein [Corynebacterium sp. MSK039]|uniref:Ppx/GppA phosphatase family protein n=1 Tax=Corynebacterium sp. MSK039 TaxID=3050193 RepID=UPI00254E66ED|nr:Ppx/GppA phosphatase family protein [Corynebacterium sp. MSK039]MDK8790588.1 Ppx/GppA phosphatase family protein [Corynebacterium sp. MSK039]